MAIKHLVDKKPTDRINLSLENNLLRKPPNCGMDITAPPTFVNQRHQIPFPRVYVWINEGRLKFLWQSLAHKEDCTIVGQTFR